MELTKDVVRDRARLMSGSSAWPLGRCRRDRGHCARPGGLG